MHMPVGPDKGRSWRAGVKCVGSSERLGVIIQAAVEWGTEQGAKNFPTTTVASG
jgi:hypothetical protein